MLVNFIIPTINIDDLNFDYKGNLDTDEYNLMIAEKFSRTNRQVQGFVNGMTYYDEYDRVTMNYDFGKRNQFSSDASLDYVLEPSEAVLFNSKKKEYEKKDILKIVESGKMSIIIVNINPNSISQDAKPDLNYWISDNNKILSDKEINDKKKLELLTKMSFFIEFDDERYVLSNCKMFEDYSDKKYPYYFALIVEKILKIKK